MLVTHLASCNMQYNYCMDPCERGRRKSNEMQTGESLWGKLELQVTSIPVRNIMNPDHHQMNSVLISKLFSAMTPSLCSDQETRLTEGSSRLFLFCCGAA